MSLILICLFRDEIPRTISTELPGTPRLLARICINALFAFPLSAEAVVYILTRSVSVNSIEFLLAPG
ncbi:uncharacterized protein METZ01_LOCUS92754 [marine metagenome]|uniref:Uncharacterized protein n=1 Tax=marine metagenome TaxID=408172 RepID=A0A381VHW2_9ZZZZ